MSDELRQRIAAFLSAHPLCIVSTAGAQGMWAMPARCRPSGSGVECLLPCWADASYYLEQDPRVLLIVLDSFDSLDSLDSGPDPGVADLRWLLILGRAHPVDSPTWDGLCAVRPLEGQYTVWRVTPTRIDLFDERRGWGARETLE